MRIAQVVADSRLLVVGTYRDTDVGPGHPLGETLAELVRLRAYVRIPLRGLDEDAVARFITLIAGRQSPALSPRCTSRPRAIPSS